MKDFHSGTEGLICQKIARGGWSGFGKALTWDPSQMITCHPKKIPKFLLKGGVVQFCQIAGRGHVGNNHEDSCRFCLLKLNLVFLFLITSLNVTHQLPGRVINCTINVINLI